VAAIDLPSRFLGSMVGSALGDAIGEIAFVYSREDLLGPQLDRIEKLCYTDDTAMAIGLAESIIETGGVDEQHLGSRFKENFEKEPWRGYASGPPTVFAMAGHMGIPFREAAGTLFGGEGSLGNGAAMRIGPAGLFFHCSWDLYHEACASARVTHTHPVGMDGAAVQAFAVARAVRTDHEKGFDAKVFAGELTEFARTPEIREKMTLVHQMLGENVPPHEAARRIGRTVAVQESMPFAVYSFLQNPLSFEDCIFCAIMNGGDRDTLGAMAGAVSGAFLGISAVPEVWRHRLENRSTIENLALRLEEVFSRQAQEH
jgi:poly(ADP-ribose) glycohydrolase ARH3